MILWLWVSNKSGCKGRSRRSGGSPFNPQSASWQKVTTLCNGSGSQHPESLLYNSQVGPGCTSPPPGIPSSFSFPMQRPTLHAWHRTCSSLQGWSSLHCHPKSRRPQTFKFVCRVSFSGINGLSQWLHTAVSSDNIVNCICIWVGPIWVALGGIA